MISRSLLRHFVFLLCLLALTVPAQAQDFDLDSLLVHSIGGPAAYDSLQQVTSYRIVGTMELNAMPGRFTMYWLAPDLFRLEVDFGQFSMLQAYDGAIAWKRDINGRVSELGGYEKKELLKQIYFQSFAYLFDGRVPGSEVYRGQETLDGKAYHKVIFRPLNDDSTIVYFAPETGRQYLTISKLDNTTTRTVSSEYQRVNGILMPFFSEATADGVQMTTTLRIEQVEFNVPIDRSLFFNEAVAPADFHFPPGQNSVTLPVRYHRGHLFVEGSVNGKRPMLFLLDSGASTNFFDQKAIAELKLPAIGELAAKGVGGHETVSLVRTDSLVVGDLVLYRQVGGVFDLSSVIGAIDPGVSDLPLGGVLGHDFLSRFPVLIDYQAGTIEVFSPNGFVPPTGGSEVPFFSTMGIPTIEASLVGVSGDYIVDLGNPYGVILHPHFVAQHNLEKHLDDIRDLSGGVGGIGGSSKIRSAYAATFGFGEVRIQSLRVMLPEGSEGVLGSEELAGNIGNVLLEGFRVLFDYAGNRLIFYPTAG